MNKKELQAAMEHFVERQDDSVAQEIYCTDKRHKMAVLQEFAEELGITLDAKKVGL